MIEIKKRIVIAFLTALGIFIAFNMLIPAVTAPIWYGSGDDSGLVGRWSCEGNFNDSSGMNNHGTQSGGVTITSGVKGRGCGFDGSNDIITVTTNTNLNTVGVSGATFSAWIYAKASQTSQFIDKRGDTASGVPGLHLLQIGTNLYFQGSNGATAFFTPAKAFSLNQWNHVVGLFNATHLLFYLNGGTPNTIAVTGQLNRSVDLFIGAMAGTTNYFNGLIDEVRIYNRSLSATEVASLYNTSKSYYLNFKATPTQGLLDETGLVGYWTFDSKDGSNRTNATDKSGLKNHGTVTGATFTNEGRFKEAYKFDGVSDNILIPDSNTLDLNNTFTISLWAKNNLIDATRQSDYYISRLVPANDNAYSVIWDYVTAPANNVVEFYVGACCYTGPSPRTNSNMTISDTNWHHIVYNYNGNQWRGYIDGVLQFSHARTFTLNASTLSTELYISSFSGAGNAVNATIDEVRIYNRSLSASEVAALYNGTKSSHITLKADPTLGIINTTADLVGYWTFDTKDGSNRTNATDKSGLQNHGTVTGATFTNEGRFKEGYKFDGVDDSIDVGSNSVLDKTTNSNFTIGFWVYPKTFTNYVSFITKSENAVAKGYVVGYDTANKVRFLADLSYSVVSNSTIALNTWAHIVAVFNTSNDVKLYINGNLDKVGNVTALTSSPYDVVFGRLYSVTSGYYFKGTIDEVRIYNRSLSASEVAGLYNGTKSNFIEWKAVVG